MYKEVFTHLLSKIRDEIYILSYKKDYSSSMVMFSMYIDRLLFEITDLNKGGEEFYERACNDLGKLYVKLLAAKYIMEKENNIIHANNKIKGLFAIRRK